MDQDDTCLRTALMVHRVGLWCVRSLTAVCSRGRVVWRASGLARPQTVMSGEGTRRQQGGRWEVACGQPIKTCRNPSPS